MAKKGANEVEVEVDERIKAEMAKLKARDEAELLAEAKAKVEAEIAAEEDAKRRLAEEETNARAHAEQAQKRHGAIRAFGDSVAAYIVEHGITNPLEIPGNAIEEMRAQAGL